MTPQPIVVGYDCSPAAHAALRWAADAAIRHDAPLRVVYASQAAPHPVRALTPFTAASLWDRDLSPDAVVARGVDGAEGRGPHATPVSGLVVDGSATAVLCEQSTQAGMLVIGAGDRRGIRIDSTSRAVAAHAACPVVVVNEHNPTQAPTGPMVVGVDDSVEAQLAIEFALAEATACGVGVTAARVWTPDPPPRHVPAREHLLRIAARAATEGDILAAAVHGWLDKYPDVDVAQTLIAGDTGPALALLSRTARLVVTAPHRHSRRPGAVSQYLLHNAACPLALAGVSAERTSIMDSKSQR